MSYCQGSTLRETGVCGGEYSSETCLASAKTVQIADFLYLCDDFDILVPAKGLSKISQTLLLQSIIY